MIEAASQNGHVIGIRVVALAVFLGPCLLPAQTSAANDFAERRERAALETITRQIAASGADMKSRGPFLPDTRKLAEKLAALLPDGRIQDEGKYGPAPSWKRVEIRTRGWAVELQALSDVQGAARRMARSIAWVQAYFQPGTMSGALIGHARYYYDGQGLVFLRRNVVVWVRVRDYPSRVYPPKFEMAKECEAVAASVDRELTALLAYF